jgi:hypothetical protein
MLLARRWSSLRQWTRQDLDGDHRTDDRLRWCSTGACTVRGILPGALLSEGSERVSVGSKRGRSRGGVARKRMTWARPWQGARAGG